MKIAWYTPYSEHSAIGRFSRLVVAALRQQNADVTIVRCERRTAEIRALQPLEDDEKCFWADDFSRSPAKRLSSFDIAVYNLGDQFDFHAFSVFHQKRVPGITVLHDYILHNALNGYCLRTNNEGGNYRGHLYSECGGEALAAMDETYAQRRPQCWWNFEIARFPLLRWAMGNTLGAVAHARHYRPLIADHIGCPTTTIPLAYDAITSAEPPPTPANEDKFTIVTVGTINPNKRYDAVIRAIHASPLLSSRCRYRIVGASDDGQAEEIQQRVDRLQPRLDVSFAGRVDRQSLEREVASAHIVSCLRYPTFEGASASVIEGLRSNRPVVVSDTGCYAEIPDALVFKVDPQKEHQDLVNHLEWIVKNYDRAKARAVKANQWAAARHNPESYATALLSFVNTVLYDQPILQITDRIAGHLARWTLENNSSLLSRVDAGMQDLFRSSRQRRNVA